MFTARRCRVQRIPPRLRGDRVVGWRAHRGSSGANCTPPVVSLDTALKAAGGWHTGCKPNANNRIAQQSGPALATSFAVAMIDA
jgi:hypothetical protein